MRLLSRFANWLSTALWNFRNGNAAAERRAANNGYSKGFH